MKDLIIKNIADIQGEPTNYGEGNAWTLKPVVSWADADKCIASFVEIPPKSYSYGYHYHDNNEEIFYIISGTGSLRTYQGDKPVKAGDMLCFPTGEKGGHVLTNVSDTDPLVYIDFSTRSGAIEIATLPDEGKYILLGEHLPMTFVDIPKKD